MRGTRILLAALAVLSASVVTPAEGLPQLTITGRTSGWVDVRVPAGGEENIAVERIQVTTSGRFGGVVVTTPHAPGIFQTVGSLVVRDFTAPGFAPRPISVGVPTLRVTGGQIMRVYLVADGPTTVSFPTSVAPGRTLRVTKRASVGVTVAALPKIGDAWSRTSRVTTRGSAIVLAGVLAEQNAVALSDVDLCVTPPGAACDASPLMRIGGEAVNEDADVELAETAQRWILRGFASRGGTFAVTQRVSHPLGLVRASGVVFTLGL